MAKKTIYVGNEFRQAFQSICRLIKGNCLEGLDYEVHGNVISAGAYNYELSDTVGRSEREEALGFTASGASWFRARRGEKMENDSAIWMSFMDNVKNAYHRNFSVVEYEQQPKTEKEKQKALRDAKKLSEVFIRTFFPSFHQEFDVRPAKGEEFAEDIYGISMRIELAAEVTTGAPLPVLCKVYFNKSGRLVRPLKREAACAIDENISNIVPDDDVARETEVSSDVIFNALDAINKLITEPKQHYADYTNFADYICFSDESDRRAVENLSRQMSHDSFELTCRRVDLLYITHIKADAFVFDICSVGVPMFRVAIGLNDTLSVSCLNCHDEELLINRNEITYEVEGERRNVLLSGSKENFGLSAEVLEELRTYSGIADHFIRVACSDNARNPSCACTKCRSQLFEVKIADKTELKCKDCPYPEIVYPALDGSRRYTPQLLFAKDRMELLSREEENMDFCKRCGRVFTRSKQGGINGKKICPLCQASDKFGEEGKKKYREYRTILPLGTRILSAFSAKCCVEDDEMIIFVIGKTAQKRYAFSKLNIKEYGPLEKPFRLKNISG